MSNVQFSKSHQDHELCVTTERGWSLLLKSMFYTTIFCMLFMLGAANSAWAAPIGCRDAGFIKCDGTNKDTCTKRCISALPSFPTRNESIIGTDHTGATKYHMLHKDVSATRYNIYDIICPAGYASGNPRILAGASEPLRYSQNYAEYVFFLNTNHSCYLSTAHTFRVYTSATPPSVGSNINMGGYRLSDWRYYERYLNVTNVTRYTYCHEYRRNWTGYFSAGCHGSRCRAGYYYYNRGQSYLGTVTFFNNCGGTFCQGSLYCAVTRYEAYYDVTGYMHLCIPPFFPQGEPMIQSVCVYTGPSWQSRSPVTKGRSNCVPYTASTTRSGESGLAPQSTGSAAGASAVNICPPAATPQAPAPGSKETPAN